MLQQYLPLAVLKLKILKLLKMSLKIVATVLTACGIETFAFGGWGRDIENRELQQYLPLAVLKLAMTGLRLL